MGQYFKPVIIDKKDSKKVVASLHYQLKTNN